MLRRIGTIAAVILAVAGTGYGIAAAAAGDTTGTNVACATAPYSTPDHTIAVDGTDVHTITGETGTATQCETQTYTIPAATTETLTSTQTDTTTATTTETQTQTQTVTQTVTQTQTVTTTPTATTQQVAPAPTGPATPTSGWKTVLADGFNSQYPLSSLWGPNGNDNNATGLTRNEAPGNTNEVADFNASQVKLDSGGLRLTAKYAPNVADNGKSYNYVSGVVVSQNYVAGEPGQQGWRNITGFRWLPTSGVTTVFEANMAAPDTSGGGEDPAFWLSTPSWLDEIDMPEMWNYGTKPWGLGFVWIYNTSTGASTRAEAWGLPQQTDASFHRWTIEFDGNTRRVNVWIDGVAHADLSFSWPASFNSAPMYLVLSHSLRNVYGDHPTWTSGSTAYRFRSVAVYQDAAHAGTGVTGGGIAPGTTIK